MGGGDRNLELDLIENHRVCTHSAKPFTDGVVIIIVRFDDKK